MSINLPAPEGLWRVSRDRHGALHAAPVIAFAGEDLYSLRTVMLSPTHGVAYSTPPEPEPGVLVYVGDGLLAKSPFPAFPVYTLETLPEEYRSLLEFSDPDRVRGDHAASAIAATTAERVLKELESRPGGFTEEQLLYRLHTPTPRVIEALAALERAGDARHIGERWYPAEPEGED